MNNRLQLIKQIAHNIQREQSQKFKGLERQAIQLSDREYCDNKKVVDNNEELNFN